jgi:hypothetical protein
MQSRCGFDVSKNGELSLPDRGTFAVPPVRTDDADKAEARERCARALKLMGNLTQPEIQEFVGYEFDRGPESVAGQMRRYYLMIKRDAPDRAELFQQQVGDIKIDAELGQKEVLKLCADVHRFVSGFVIRHDGKLYSSNSLIVE